MNDRKTVYVDHAGATIPSKQLLENVFSELITYDFGNPHSNGSYSFRSSNVVDEARAAVLEHFNVSENQYEIIFTSGATSSIKMVGECFPWKCDSVLLHPRNAHTSLLGLRSYSPNTLCVPSSTFHSDHVDYVKSESDWFQSDQVAGFNLLVVPGECNFSGSKANLYSSTSFVNSCCNSSGTVFLQRIEGALMTKSATGTLNNNYPWLWLLDAAKLASNSPIDLSAMPTPPHFVAISFYKIFGYPTGLGALLVRRDVLPVLQKT